MKRSCSAAQTRGWPSARSLRRAESLFQARFLGGPHKALRVGIEIRGAWRQLNRLHSGGFQDLQEFSGEQGIPVVDQVALPGQKAFRSVTEVASDLTHPKAIGLPGHSGDLDPPTRQVD